MKKLTLTKETVKVLNDDQLENVAGAATILAVTHGYCSNQNSICRCPSWGGCTVGVSLGCPI